MLSTTDCTAGAALRCHNKRQSLQPALDNNVRVAQKAATMGYMLLPVDSATASPRGRRQRFLQSLTISKLYKAVTLPCLVGAELVASSGAPPVLTAHTPAEPTQQVHASQIMS